MTSPTHLYYDTYYHIYNRGTNRENIFFEERNYDHFMNLFAQHVVLAAQLFAFCLLKNHFHLLVRIKSREEIISHDIDESLNDSFPSKKFSIFFNAYAQAINRAYDRTGSLFEHPFKRRLIANDCQFWNVVAYIHQNPQKHNFVRDFRDWRWSSYPVMLSDSPTHLQRNAVLEWFGGKQQYLDLHSHWVTATESKRFAAGGED